MNRYISLMVFLIGTLFSVNSIAVQDKVQLGLEVEQVSLYTVVSPEIVSANGESYLLTPEPISSRKVGVKIKTVGNASSWLEVFPVGSKNPPTTLDPISPNVFLLVGEPGSEYWVSVKDKDTGRPQWQLVTIQPTGPPIDNPDVPDDSLKGLSTLVAEEVSKLDDPATKKALSEAYSQASDLSSPENVDLESSKKLTVSLINKVMNERVNKTVDWSVFRGKLDEWFNTNIKTKDTYIKALKEVSNSLKLTVTTSTQEEEKKELIIKFGATWCGPCHVLDNTIKNSSSIKKALGERKIRSIDVSAPSTIEDKEWVNLVSPKVVPLLIRYTWDSNKSQWVEKIRMEGAVSEQAILNFLNL